MKHLYAIQIVMLALLLTGLFLVSGMILIGHAQAIQQVTAGCGCGLGTLAWWSWPLALAAASFLLFFLYHVVQLFSAQARFYRTISAQEAPVPHLLKKLAWKHRIRIMLISSDRMEAFTTGFLRPRVVVSTALLQQLTPEELRAVLLHEARHAHAFHPLFSFVLILAQRILRLPQTFVEYIRFLAEREADRVAIAYTSARTLARALVKVLRDDPQPLPSTVHTFSSTSMRVQRLLHEPIAIPRILILQNMVFAVAAILVISAVAVLFSHVSPVQAEIGSMCASVPYCAGEVLRSPMPIYPELPHNASILFTSFH